MTECNRLEILARIQQLLIQKDEAQCDAASHQLDLSDAYERSIARFNRKLQAEYKKLNLLTKEIRDAKCSNN